MPGRPGASPRTAFTTWSRSKTPMSASMPGAHSSSFARWRCTRHPATTARESAPRDVRSIASRITPSDSSLLASRNPHVLTTIASGESDSLTSVSPSSRSIPSIFSLSTRFLGQPRLTNATRETGRSRESAALDRGEPREGIPASLGGQAPCLKRWRDGRGDSRSRSVRPASRACGRFHAPR